MISLILLAASAAIGPVPPFSFPKQDLSPIDVEQVAEWRTAAWGWCNRDAANDPAGVCMINQDSAVVGIARSMRTLADPGEQAELASAARGECSRMFAEHQGNDLRILNICLERYATSVRALMP